ncbi:MAG: putative metal-dependent peptidase [Gammaproteobacteria bacterium]|jgi:predicted metal-dependent peptidase
MNIDNKLTAARTRLILDKPFLGALSLRLQLQAVNNPQTRTTSSDGLSFFYNPAYLDLLDVEQTQFVISREALHCALLHFSRRGHRLKHLWDLACAYAINPILIADGLKPPPDTLVDLSFDGMTAEEIYPCLQDNENDAERELPDEQKKDNDSNSEPQPDRSNLRPNSQPEHSPLSATERQQLESQWQQRLTGAAQQARLAGKLSGNLERLVEQFLQPQLPWRNLLAQFLMDRARNDYSYQRPSTRRGGPAVFPGLRSHEVNLVVALDTSGSISEDEIHEFVSEVSAIKAQANARLTLLCCDTRIDDDSPQHFEPWQPFEINTKIKGGGGTRFTPVFDWVNLQDIAPDALIYFTDGRGEFPIEAPCFPVIWLVKGHSSVPFGRRIALN